MKSFLILSLTIFSLILFPLVVPIQEVIADNTVTKIIKLTGSLIGTDEDEDFLLPESLTNLNKTITFMSVRHLGDGNAKEIYRSWDFINNTALRFHGSSNFPANNAPMDFVAYFVEFTAGSDMIVQNGTLIVDGGDVNQEFIATLSPSVNATNSFFMFDGLNMDHADLSWGSEEFGIMRVKNDTSWGYEPADAPNSGDTEVRFSVIDWNNSNFIIQNGTGALQDQDFLDTIVPSPSIDRRHTIVLISTSFDGELDATSDEYGVTGRINSSNEIEIEREDADCGTGSNCIVNYRWELITFPTTFANVTHDQIFKSGTTGDDETVSTIDVFSPALGNASKAIAIGTNHNPMGLGQARDSSGAGGSWDRNAYTIELLNATAVNGTANDARNSATVPYQVIEFLEPAGQVFDQDILDVATAVDLSQNKNVTKLATDTVTTADTISTGRILVVNLNDTGIATDVTAINVTKLNLDLVTALDNVDLTTTKGVIDTATILEQVNTETIFLVLLTDLASTTDEVALAITKILADNVVSSDEINFVITKLLDDTVIVSDLANATATFGVDELDTISANDLVILDVTKQLTDVASTIDDLNLEPTKVFLDTTVVVDTTQADKDAGINATDSVGTVDNLVIDVTKLIQDVSTIQDNVVLIRILDIAINDTVTVNDPAIFFTIATNQTAGGSGSASSGAGVPTFQRLVGLSILSELFNVVPKDNVPSDFVISTFGMMNTAVEISNIEPDQQFNTWFQFETFPTTLRFNTEVDSSRTVNDPARFQNTALESFVLTIPLTSCEGLDPFVTPVPCIDPLVYEIPIIFTITKGGVEFKEKHIVTVDATERIPCDIICQIVDFITQNYWWLAGILIVFMMMYFLRGAITKRGVRTVRKVNKSHFNSFSANTPKRKFKRGKGR